MFIKYFVVFSWCALKDLVNPSLRDLDPIDSLVLMWSNVLSKNLNELITFHPTFPRHSFNKFAQSNLGTGHDTSPGGRTTHSRRTQSYNCICQVVPMCMHTSLIHDSLSPPYSQSQTVNQSVWLFYMARAAFSQYITLCCFISPPKKKIAHY